jgi:subtilisin family serine protease
MKNNSNGHQPGDEEFLFRIVIKFNGALHASGGVNNLSPVNYFSRWQKIVDQFPGITINSLFTTIEPATISKLIWKAKRSDKNYKSADLLSYAAIDCAPSHDQDRLLNLLAREKNIAFAYFEIVPAILPSSPSRKNPFSRFQQYLDAAPLGIDAKYAWAFAGGLGEGDLKFIDIELGWIFGHEDILVHTFPDTGISQVNYQDHGTAVLGIIMMKNNRLGGIGITPDISGYVISQVRADGVFNTADAIMTAISYLNAGDILLLETQCFDSSACSKMWPIEIQDAVFELIRLATALGIIVIEAAGNGNLAVGIGNDLDRFSWRKKKILNRSAPDFNDSGAIMVAAATSSIPHGRIEDSNFGSRIDCYAWGEQVATAGLFPRSSGYAINTYTEDFGGTSSAAAIIAGVAIAIQSILRTNKCKLLTPEQMRDILSSDLYGTSSQRGRLKDKIGVMPDLKKILEKKFRFKKFKKRP